MKEKEIISLQPSEERLYGHIAPLIRKARQQIATTVNIAMAYTNYNIGKYIVENELDGTYRAMYGKQVLERLSMRLTAEFGKGFSATNLKCMRLFYTIYSQSSIRQTVSDEFQLTEKKETTIHQIPSIEFASQDFAPSFTLSWSHYLILMRIENPQERSFYEIEATNQQWSVAQLSRQYNSSLYERLALSRDKDAIMRLAQEGQILYNPEDVLKSPITLEFLGMEEKAGYSESDLESNIISKLQFFLLEMGKGFLFEARQKRFTFDEKHFFVDLVLYNRLLQCYTLIDLKTNELTHQDLGQMQMYVNYYDRYVKQDFEKPTIGILLCKQQNKTLVELTLPKDAQIYAAAYNLYLPDKGLLQKKLNEWIQEYENEQTYSKVTETLKKNKEE